MTALDVGEDDCALKRVRGIRACYWVGYGLGFSYGWRWKSETVPPDWFADFPVSEFPDFSVNFPDLTRIFERVCPAQPTVFTSV